MKKIVLFAMGLAVSAAALAQEKVETTISGDVVSSYIWRGQDLGHVSLNIGITDYWFNSGLDPENRYFKYYAHGTNHVFEANVGYDFGFVGLQWFTNFAGNDGMNNDGKRAYSSYVELSVPFKLATVDWTATAGAVPFSTDFYGTDGFAVTNLALKATKDIQVTETFSVPVFGQVVANPCSQKAYLVIGFTLQP